MGDSFGTVGLDHLAYPGLIKRLIGGSYVNGPASKPAPKIYAMILADQVEAYNLPLGVLMHLHRDIAAKKPGVITKIGLGTFVDPRDRRRADERRDPAGSRRSGPAPGRGMAPLPRLPHRCCHHPGHHGGHARELTSEHEGVVLAVLAQAIGSAQFRREGDRPGETGGGGGDAGPAESEGPGILVDALVVDPEQRQNTGIAYDPAISGEIRAAAFPVEPVPLGPEKAIARRALCRSGRATS